MLFHEDFFPSLNINLKNLCDEEPIKLKKKSRNILNSPSSSINKIKAYSFFDLIKEKERKSKEVKSEHVQNVSNNNRYKLLSIDNYRSKLKNEIKNTNSLIINQLFDKIRKESPSKINYYNFFVPSPDDYLSQKLFLSKRKSSLNIFNNAIKFKSILIVQKEKEKLYKRIIENKYNINLNRVKSYSKNKKLFINGFRKNPKYFSKFKSYIKSRKSLSYNNSDISEHLNKSNCANTTNSKDEKNSKSINVFKGILNNNINQNNMKYRHIKLKKINIHKCNEHLSKTIKQAK